MRHSFTFLLARYLIPMTTLLVFLLPETTVCIADANSSEIVRIGVLAKRGEAVAMAKWQATADYLSERSPSRHFEIIPLAFDEIPPVVRNRLIDFVIVNSAIFVDLSVDYGIRRILTMKNRVANRQSASQFGAVIFVHHEDRSTMGWSDLAGKHLAAVHETSLGGWILGRYAIEQGGVDIDDLKLLTFSGTHDKVVRDVLARRADVGVVRTDTLERMAAEGDVDLSQIRLFNPQRSENFPLLLSTGLVPEWPISELPHVSDELSGEVAVALLQMKASDKAAVDAKITGWSIPQNYQAVHEILKSLHLPPYDIDSEITLLSVIQRYWYWILIFMALLIAQSGLIANIARLNRRLRNQQQTLLESQEQFRSLFQQAAVGFVIAAPTGTIKQANHRLSEITGYSEVELRELNIIDLLHSVSLSQVTTQFEMMRRGEISQFFVQAQIKAYHQREVWVQLTLNAVRGERNSIKYLVAVFDEITELKTLEHQLKAEQTQKSLILDIAGDGILGLDREGKHTFVNPAAARLLGYSVEEMIGEDSHALWHHSYADGSPFPGTECPITAVLSSGVIHRGTSELFWRKDGSSLPTEYVSTPICEEGKVTGAVVIFRERLEAQSDLYSLKGTEG